jgi:hypothetical protein
MTGLTGSYDRYFMRVEFGELFIGNGNYIAKIDSEGTLTEKAFTLPVGWIVVDMSFVADTGLILARHVNRLSNFCKAYWWDLTSTEQFDDAITISHGGPQWIVNFNERLFALCAQNGVAKLYSAQASTGAKLFEVPGIEMKNVASETATQEISSPKMLAFKDGILYFGLYKTDKTGIYAVGSLSEDKPMALILAKRFDTTDYANHIPIALHTQGPNFFGSYTDDGSFKHSRCESNNNPSRSSNAIYESIILDEGDQSRNKELLTVLMLTKPLPDGTSIRVWDSNDYGTYTQIYEEDATNFDTANGLLGWYNAKSIQGKTHQIKFQLTSYGSQSPKVTGLGYLVRVADKPAYV